MSVGRFMPYDCLNIIYSFLSAKNKIIMKHNYLIRNIISYLPITFQILISKYYYAKHKHKILIPPYKLYPFLTNIVKHNLDNAFIEYMKKINIDHWFVTPHKYYYGDYMFLNYISLLEHICIKNNAYKCLLIIQNLKKANKTNTNKTNKTNKHKNKMYKNIIWK